MAPIKTVAIAGASGSLGSVIFQRLVASGKFKVRVLRRLGSGSQFPAGTDVVDVDFGSADAVKAALTGQDAVVSALSTGGEGSQKALVDGAVAAGVQRFLPSDFGSNLDNPNAQKLPVYGPKIEGQRYLEERAKGTGLTWTRVYNNAFLDWGLKHKFIADVSGTAATTVYNGGDLPFSTTTLASVGDGVVGVLSHPDETANRSVKIHNAAITQNQLVAWARRAAPNKTFDVVNTTLDEVTAAADARLAKGLFDMQTFAPYLMRAVFDPQYGGNFTGKTDNELLGVKELSEEEIFQVVKAHVPA